MNQRLVYLIDVAGKEGYGWATTRWLRRQVSNGRLRYYKPVGRVLIDLNDLDALVEQGRFEADPYTSRRRRRRGRT